MSKMVKLNRGLAHKILKASYGELVELCEEYNIIFEGSAYLKKCELQFALLDKMQDENSEIAISEDNLLQVLKMSAKEVRNYFPNCKPLAKWTEQFFLLDDLSKGRTYLRDAEGKEDVTESIDELVDGIKKDTEIESLKDVIKQQEEVIAILQRKLEYIQKILNNTPVIF